jgi:hypothetical protein
MMRRANKRVERKKRREREREMERMRGIDWRKAR